MTPTGRRRLGAARRWAAACAVASLAAAPSGVAASPPPDDGHDPHDPMAADRPAGDDTLVGVGDPLASGDPAAIAEAVAAVDADVARQLDDLTAARGAVDAAVAARADADAAVQATELAIEELTAQSDAVVIEAFMNPPAGDALAVLTSESISDAAVRHALLDMDADESADVLGRLADARDALHDERGVQDRRRADAADAESRAAAALDGLEAALDRRAIFVLDVQGRLDSAAAVATDPAEAAGIDARRAALQAALDDEQARRDAEAAAAAREQARQEAAASPPASPPAGPGGFLCPVDGPLRFDDTWAAPRSGGRIHQGTDVMADTGVPTVAPAPGRVEHRGTSLGGLSWFLYGDDGHTYYGTHLSAYESEGAGHVEAGTVIGYVGATGNANGTPHLHFELHPDGGDAVNPYSRLDAACPDH